MQTNILTFFSDFLKYTQEDWENLTFGMIKPDFYQYREEMLRDLKNEFGFQIVFRASYNIKPIAPAFYAEHDALHNGGECRHFFPGLIKVESSGPSEILLLQHAPIKMEDEVILCWKQLRNALGPKDPRQGDMGKIRHKYYHLKFGNNYLPYDNGEATNGSHASDSEKAAILEASKMLCAMYRDAWFKQCKDGKCPIQMVAA